MSTTYLSAIRQAKRLADGVARLGNEVVMPHLNPEEGRIAGCSTAAF